MRQPRPDREDLDALLPERLEHDADDAGRPLVARRLDLKALEQLGVGREARHDDRLRVDDVGEICADQQTALDAHVDGELDDGLAVAPPAGMRLDGEAGDELEALRGHAVAERVGRPVDLARVARLIADFGPVDREVVVVVGIDLGERNGAHDVVDETNRTRRGFAGVVPALERQHEGRLSEDRSHVHA